MSNGLFVWSNGTADYRPGVLHAFHRSTIGRAANRRQRAACGQVFAPRIAFTPSAAPESARCGNCRLVINDYAAPPEPPREPRKPGDPTADHFAVYASGRLIRWRDGSVSQGARALCGAGWRRESKTVYMRETTFVSCPACMIIKDRWLELGGRASHKNRPLTIRRAREWIAHAMPKGWRLP
jgi:hypothetical protein